MTNCFKAELQEKVQMLQCSGVAPKMQGLHDHSLIKYMFYPIPAAFSPRGMRSSAGALGAPPAGEHRSVLLPQTRGHQTF